MNFNEFDNKIKSLTKDNDTNESQLISERVNKTLYLIDKKKKSKLKIIKISSIAASIILAILITTCFTNQKIVYALSEIPIIRTIFEHSGSKSLESIGKSGKTHIKTLTAKDKGIEVLLKEVVSDDCIGYAGFEIAGSNEPIYISSVSIYLDDKLIEDTMAWKSFEELKKVNNNYPNVIRMWNNTNVPENSKVKIAINKLTTKNTDGSSKIINGNWTFENFSINKIKGTKNIKFNNISKTYNGIKLSVENIKLTKTTMDCTVKIYFESMQHNIELGIFDENGNEYDPIGGKEEAESINDDKYKYVSSRNYKVIFDEDTNKNFIIKPETLVIQSKIDLNNIKTPLKLVDMVTYGHVGKNNLYYAIENVEIKDDKFRIKIIDQMMSFHSPLEIIDDKGKVYNLKERGHEQINGERFIFDYISEPIKNKSNLKLVCKKSLDKRELSNLEIKIDIK